MDRRVWVPRAYTETTLKSLALLSNLNIRRFSVLSIGSTPREGGEGARARVKMEGREGARERGSEAKGEWEKAESFHVTNSVNLCPRLLLSIFQIEQHVEFCLGPLVTRARPGLWVGRAAAAAAHRRGGTTRARIGGSHHGLVGSLALRLVWEERCTLSVENISRWGRDMDENEPSMMACSRAHSTPVHKIGQ